MQVDASDTSCTSSTTPSYASGSSTPVVSYDEVMFMWGVLIFFVAFPCWYLMFRKPNNV